MSVSNPIEEREPSIGDSRAPYFLWVIWIIWIPFIIPDIIKLFQSHPSIVRLFATLIVVTLFFGVYLWATWRNVQSLVSVSSPTGNTIISQWLPIAILFIISLTIVQLYNSLGTPFIFTSAYIGGRLPTVRAAQTVILLTLFVLVTGLLNAHTDWSYLGQGAILIAGVGIVTICIVRTITTGRELRLAREEIARLAVTAERLRIARDLHDLLGHNLSLITLKSELAGRLISVAPERAANEIGDVEQVARTTLQEVREAVGNYRQSTLANELHAAQQILMAAGIVYACEADENIQGSLSPVIEAVMSWTVREGVTNVIRHSRARHCTVRITRDTHDAHVEVIDDGTKTSVLPSSHVVKMSTTTASNGLRGLTERITALGGRCEATAQERGGFRLAVSVPLV